MNKIIENLMNQLLIYLRKEEGFKKEAIEYWFQMECPDVVWEWRENTIVVLAVNGD